MTGCNLVSGWFAYLVQGLLGVSAFSTLLIKWRREKPRRAFWTWARDASKQLISAFLAHVLNVVFALVLDAYGNQCVWYFNNYVIDNVLGVLGNWLLLGAVEKLARRRGTRVLESGYYGIPPQNKIWGLQLLVWAVIICFVKVVLFYAILVPLHPQLAVAGSWVLYPVLDHPKAELAIVMIVVPLICNVLQFWIQDNFLKLSKMRRKASAETPLLGEGDSSSQSESSNPYSGTSQPGSVAVVSPPVAARPAAESIESLTDRVGSVESRVEGLDHKVARLQISMSVHTPSAPDSPFSEGPASDSVRSLVSGDACPWEEIRERFDVSADTSDPPSDLTTYVAASPADESLRFFGVQADDSVYGLDTHGHWTRLQSTRFDSSISNSL